jgi:glycosyltransferase involved in cell wall biosynthesis
MKISALVVTYNDKKHLAACLAALKRFDELVVVDIGSSDGSFETALQFGDRVFQRSWVPAVEIILPDIIDLPCNDWILRVDPDEVLPPALVDDLLKLNVGETCGMVAIPFQYYFLGKKLDTTVWGGVKYGNRLSHKERTILESQVHRTYQCKDGFETLTLDFKGNNDVMHFWIDSYSQLFSKHERYLRMEGQSRYSQGQRFSWSKLVNYTWKMFRKSLVEQSGWRGGWVGWFLSFFYAHYEMRGWLSLRKHQHSQKDGQA